MRTQALLGFNKEQSIGLMGIKPSMPIRQETECSSRLRSAHPRSLKYPPISFSLRPSNANRNLVWFLPQRGSEQSPPKARDGKLRQPNPYFLRPRAATAATFSISE